MGIPFQLDGAFPPFVGGLLVLLEDVVSSNTGRVSVGVAEGATVTVGVEVSVGVGVGVGFDVNDERRLQADIPIPNRTNAIERCV